MILLLIAASAFFSATEAALMRLNRYKVQADATHNTLAKLTEGLLERLDKILTVILLGNTFANIMTGTLLVHLLEEIDASEQITYLAPIILTIVILLFAEVMPKTMATIKPTLFAYACAPVIWLISILLTPVTMIINAINNKIIAVFGMNHAQSQEIISFSEYKMMVSEGMKHQKQSHHRMMMGVLELHEITVNDIMLTRSKIQVLDMSDTEEIILKEIISCAHSRLPVIEGDIENILGIVNIRECIHMILTNKFTKESLRSLIQEAYFIPEKTPLHTQFMRFQQMQKKMALILNEYGHLQGLVTLSDIMDEIWVADIQLQDIAQEHEVIRLSEHAWIFPGHLPVHTLKRLLGWSISTRDASTIGGALIAYMECLPQPGTSILLNGIIYEILQISKNTIVKIKGISLEHYNQEKQG
jgi:Mg2+/Co2+ transporter CorB